MILRFNYCNLFWQEKVFLLAGNLHAKGWQSHDILQMFGKWHHKISENNEFTNSLSISYLWDQALIKQFVMNNLKVHKNCENKFISLKSKNHIEQNTVPKRRTMIRSFNFIFLKYGSLHATARHGVIRKWRKRWKSYGTTD